MCYGGGGGYGGYGYGGYGYGGYGYGGYGYGGYGYGYGYGYGGYGSNGSYGIGGDGTKPSNIKTENGQNVAGNDTSGRATNAAGERLTSGYDTSRDGGTTVHSGIDIVPLKSDGTVDANAKVQSISNGTVVDVGVHTGFGSHTVVVQNSDGNYITYGHMSSADVHVGDTVTPGTSLGTVGTEGNSTGIHVHIQESTGGAFATSSGFTGFVDPGSH